ncbi:MAG: hypothetical protein WD669_06645 [Pirellulales bacterium]
MPIEVTCPSCNRRFNAPDNAAGKKAKCPQCGGVIAIPIAAPPPPPPTEDIFDAEFDPNRPFADEDFEVEPPVQIASIGSTGIQKPCPMCGEMIQASAVKCRFCGEIFDPLLKKKAKRAGSSSEDDDLSTVDWVLAILCSGIGCIVGIVYLIQGKPKAGKMILVSIAVGVLWNIVTALLQGLAGVNR